MSFGYTIPRVHCDKKSTRHVKFNVPALKHEPKNKYFIENIYQNA